MNAARHIFMFRNALDLHNNELNEKKASMVQQKTGYNLQLNAFGRVELSNHIATTTQEVRCSNVFHQAFTGDNNSDVESYSGDIPSVTGTAAAQESVSNHTSSSTSASTSADQPKDSSTETSSKQPSPSHISQSHTKDSYTYTVEADELSVIDLTGPEASELPDDTSYRSVWIPSLYLTQVELGILNRKECLTDTVIEAGQILLKKQFSYICGLQPPCLSQSPYGFDVQPGEFVQIIHLHFHWLTLSTIGCQPSEINVYDSMQSNNYSQVLKKTAASLMLSKENQIKFNIINVTQQKDGTSCGVYALAFASALCLKIDPSELIFDHARMYCDLKKCLEIGQMGFDWSG
ncbi:hypothetical protein BSL78_02661 [Apostichopus japonicus]|uniref:Ubiquitin-like protease family profile domain-containing protein n=1 Tax=Stichopus japonicus TaxID=307972 RepID=A0A2G8LJL7_STIJA|nr:hypothetical protein BSL78_02661 [Apostichopus japonicus]